MQLTSAYLQGVVTHAQPPTRPSMHSFACSLAHIALVILIRPIARSASDQNCSSSCRSARWQKNLVLTICKHRLPDCLPCLPVHVFPVTQPAEDACTCCATGPTCQSLAHGHLACTSWSAYFSGPQTAGLSGLPVILSAHRIRNISKADGNVLLQVLTVMQQALCVMKGFPYIADKARALEVLAAMRGEPSTILLAQPADQDDFEHHISWQRVVNYLKTVTCTCMFPLPQTLEEPTSAKVP